MNIDHDPALAGAMGCLDCGRLLTIGEACVCVTDAFADDGENESTFDRDLNCRSASGFWWDRS